MTTADREALAGGPRCGAPDPAPRASLDGPGAAIRIADRDHAPRGLERPPSREGSAARASESRSRRSIVGPWASGARHGSDFLFAPSPPNLRVRSEGHASPWPQPDDTPTTHIYQVES